MSSTHLSLHAHIVWGTKDHVPRIAAEWRPRLHAYIGGTLRSLGVVPLAVGGVADHVHILIGFRGTHALADFMRDVKRSSAVWIMETLGARKFIWQEGYGAFTVSPNAVEDVRKYIQNQEHHHLHRTFREEYVDFLERSATEYNADYLD